MPGGRNAGQARQQALPRFTAATFAHPWVPPCRPLPNVFSREGLDLGTRFLLEQLAQLRPVARAVDLACGNGVIGLAALQRGLASELWFCDESAQAIASARLNLETVLPEQVAQAHFHHGDGLRDWSAPAPDLILCNPPFHLQHTVDDYAGRRLLSQAAAVLAPGGQLCLVANRHLDYRRTLAQGFRQQRILAQNRKFRVYLASR
jgi:23S rRNA (guanine1835-N2)-methyltransferase